MIRIDRFCCFSLETAGKIIGWYGFLTAILAIIGNVGVLSDLDAILINSTIYDHIDETTARTITEIYISVDLAIMIAHLLASICLIVGTIQRNQVLITPWLVTQGTIIIVAVLGCTIVSIFVMINIGSIGILTFGLGALSIALATYFWIAIYSLMCSVRDGQMRRLLESGNEPRYMQIP